MISLTMCLISGNEEWEYTFYFFLSSFSCLDKFYGSKNEIKNISKEIKSHL